MKIPQNRFKAALRAGHSQIGLWIGLPGADAPEMLAPTGFDWFVLDAEHAPNDPRSILEQLRAVAPYDVTPVVRPVQADVGLVKQYTDAGAQTLLVPMIDTAAQADLMARAMRYPMQGIRGMGGALVRATRWTQIDDYAAQANEQMCLLVQAETPTAIGNLEAITGTDGVDGVFFGPADLAATMGHLGQPAHPEVQKVILAGIATVRRLGKAAGVLAVDPALAQRYLDAGAQFVAVGVDTSLLVHGARALRAQFR